jgi:hypothetical protein
MSLKKNARTLQASQTRTQNKLRATKLVETKREMISLLSILEKSRRMKKWFEHAQKNCYLMYKIINA